MTQSESVPECELCRDDGGRVVLRDEVLRVALVDDPRYPGFCRVIANRHVKEMTDLDEAERRRVLDTVLAVESALRTLLEPDKVNLASLGNVTPHVHWHVIPRWHADARFPQPIWGEPLRSGSVPSLAPDFVARLEAMLLGSRPRR